MTWHNLHDQFHNNEHTNYTVVKHLLLFVILGQADSTWTPFTLIVLVQHMTLAHQPCWRFTCTGHERYEQKDLETDWQARVTIQFVPERLTSSADGKVDTWAAESIRTHSEGIHKHRYTPWKPSLTRALRVTQKTNHTLCSAGCSFVFTGHKFLPNWCNWID